MQKNTRWEKLLLDETSFCHRIGRIQRTFWAALVGALVCGILAHGMGLFNKLSWHDDIFPCL